MISEKLVMERVMGRCLIRNNPQTPSKDLISTIFAQQIQFKRLAWSGIDIYQEVDSPSRDFRRVSSPVAQLVQFFHFVSILIVHSNYTFSSWMSIYSFISSCSLCSLLDCQCFSKRRFAVSSQQIILIHICLMTLGALRTSDFFFLRPLKQLFL